MAKRRKSKTNPYIWYALYVIAGYYGYSWFMAPKTMQSTMVSVPPGTQT